MQKVGNTTYFHVSFARPRNMVLPVFSAGQVGTEGYKRALARLPALIPRDARTSHVYLLPVSSDSAPRPLDFSKDAIHFVGRLKDPGQARFQLRYPVPANARPAQAGMAPPPSWQAVDVVLSFTEAKTIPLPATKAERASERAIAVNDLQRLWAAGQASRFAVLEALAPDCSFFPFAREATGRKYRVDASAALVSRAKARPEELQRRLYDMTTSAAAIAVSLQRERLRSPYFRGTERRNIPVADVPGVDRVKRPWEEMIAGKKPAPEPLARFVPYDQYFVHFKNVPAFLEFLDLFEQWGNELTNAFEINSREYNLRNRYDKQLCVGSRGMARSIAPLVMNDLAITGSDLFFRDGTDITYIFRVVNSRLFLWTADPYLRAARREFGSRLQESRSTHRGIAIESYVTPLREISMHRAFPKDDIVVYSNSLVALRRVLDTYLGHDKRLTDSRDFQYFRTVFRHDDKREDGFFFLPSAFIRRQVGPTIKIKQRRRLEAMTSLYMTTHAALFAGWEQVGPPADIKEVLAAASLRPEQIYVPEGNPVVWDSARKRAVSDAYNTLHFATPLVELPIDRITPSEEREYKRLREEYRRHWGNFVDPIATRFTLDRGAIRIETFVLPLVNNSWYDVMRLWTQGGTIALRPSTFSSSAVFRYRAFLNAALFDAPQGKNEPEKPRQSSLGNWFSIALDDSPVFPELVKVLIRQQLETITSAELLQEASRLLLSTPLTLAVGVRDRQAFQRQLDDYEDIFQWLIGPFTLKKEQPSYRGIAITAVRFSSRSRLARLLGVNGDLTARPLFHPVLYHAIIGDGWYLSLTEASLKERIARSIARPKPMKAAKPVLASSSLYVAPAAAPHAAAALRSYLEWECHRRALANAVEWYALFRCGAIDPAATEKRKLQAALHYLGYAPISPDGGSYRYDALADQVENARHGSFLRPILHADLAPTTPVSQLLDQFRSMRVDLRFLEDGIHTMVTLERKAVKKK
jgi:hypothetical protein